MWVGSGWVGGGGVWFFFFFVGFFGFVFDLFFPLQKPKQSSLSRCVE